MFVYPRKLRLRWCAETRNLLSVRARDIRANTLISLSRVNPRNSRLAQPFKGRSKVLPSSFCILLIETDSSIEMRFFSRFAIKRKKSVLFISSYFMIIMKFYSHFIVKSPLRRFRKRCVYSPISDTLPPTLLWNRSSISHYLNRPRRLSLIYLSCIICRIANALPRITAGSNDLRLLHDGKTQDSVRRVVSHVRRQYIRDQKSR